MARKTRRNHDKAARARLGAYTFVKKGVPTFDLSDPYHVAVTLTWPQFLTALFGLYLAVNLLFALLYTLVPGSIANARPHDFGQAFFFSFETLATVGYGEFYPGNLYGHLVACAEITSGVGFTAILTGLTFVRFSRPRAKFVFAEKLVVATYNGVPTLMVRVGNGRPGVMTDAAAKLSVLSSELSEDGFRFRRAHELVLERSSTPIFPLTWTLLHRVVQGSPLYGLDAATLEANDARILLSFQAHDPTLGTTVQAVRAYGPADVMFGTRYIDVITVMEDGNPMADLNRLSDVEPDVGPSRPIMGWAEADGGGGQA